VRIRLPQSIVSRYRNQRHSIPSLVTLHMGLEVLLNDMQRLIEEGVKSSIRQKSLQRVYVEGDQQATQQMRFLDSWIGAEKKWSLECKEHQALVRAVTGNLTSLHAVLLPGIDHTMSRARIAKHLVSLSQSRSGPPYSLGGQFQTILPLLITSLQALFQVIDNPSGDTFEEWFALLVNVVFAEMGVDFLCWNPPGTPGSTYAVHNYFVNTYVVGIPFQRAAATASVTPVSIPSGGVWRISQAPLSTFLNYLQHRRLPRDYEGPTSNDEEILDVETWIQASFGQNNDPVHHLCLIVAIFLNSIAPYFEFVTTKKIPVNATSPFQGIRTVQWETKTGGSSKHKTRNKGAKVFSGWLFYAMALLNPESPLRQRLDSAPGKGLGETWTGIFST
jgi:hypothetical protein